MPSDSSASPSPPPLDAAFNPQIGLLTLQGPTVELRRRLDALFRHWASFVNAIEYSFPPVLSVVSLELADYFNSFPHLATLTTQIDPSDQGVNTFVEATQGQPLSEIATDYLTPARYVLPSAACYAVYNHFQGQQLSQDLYVTPCSPCFRHEATYTAGERQWMFHMREIVCIGSAESVQRFLQTYRDLLTEKLNAAGLPFQLREATDPFFDRRDPRRLAQRVDPLKYEFLYQDTLAISSLNFHRDFFGHRFQIHNPAGNALSSGCVAFGLERWLTACLQEYGPNWDHWPASLKPPVLT